MLETSLLSIRIKVLIFYVIYLFVFENSIFVKAFRPISEKKWGGYSTPSPMAAWPLAITSGPKYQVRNTKWIFSALLQNDLVLVVQS